MILCKKCVKPVRYVGSTIVVPFGEVIGAECPDEKCKGVRVVLSAEWVANLQEIK